MYWHLFFISIIGLISLIFTGCDSASDDSGTKTNATRTYASQFLAYGDYISQPITVYCDFDTNTAELNCYAEYIDQYQLESLQTKTWYYESVDDFIDEASIVGKVLYRLTEWSNDGFGLFVIPSGAGAVENEFDESNIIISTNGVDYTSWDSFGRPLTAEPTDICTDDTGDTYYYNDAERIVIKTYNSRTSTVPGDGTIPCIQYSINTEYDEYGNVIKTISSSGTIYYDLIAYDTVSK